jgi:hypothetical protein
VSDDPQELCQAEDGQCPRIVAFGELSKPFERRLVMLELRAVRVDEDIGIDRDQTRPSITS